MQSITPSPTFVPAAVAILSWAASNALAAPITVTVIQDSALSFQGVIGGSIADSNPTTVGATQLTADIWAVAQTVPFDFSTQHWHVSGRVNRWAYFTGSEIPVNLEDLANAQYLGDYIDLLAKGQHLVAPHSSEAAPNPLETTVWQSNLDGSAQPRVPDFKAEVIGLAIVPAGAKLTDSINHPIGPHQDSMGLSITDLNGAAAGVTNNLQLAAVVTLNHPVPEPATVTLLAAALPWFVRGFRRRSVPAG